MKYVECCISIKAISVLFLCIHFVAEENVLEKENKLSLDFITEYDV